MKQLVHYICETCGSVYCNERDAMNCEKGHVLPKTIRKSHFARSLFDKNGTYPVSMDIEFDNHVVVTYIKHT